MSIAALAPSIPAAAEPRAVIVDRTAASPAATEALAAAIAAALRPGDIVALIGDLGAGKTTLARGLIAARAAAGGAPMPEVPSPTFTLVQTYELTGGTIWHFDLYRLERADDAVELGIEEAFIDGISLIEWPERLGALLPPSHIRIALQFTPQPTSRRVVVSVPEPDRQRFAAALGHD